MAITIQIPPDIERDLRSNISNLDQTAKEAMLIEFYRQDDLTYHQLSQALGRDHFETEALLKKHRVTEDFPTDDQYDAALHRLGVGTRK